MLISCNGRLCSCSIDSCRLQAYVAYCCACVCALQSLLEEVLQEIARQYPSLLVPLIHERDVYLGWSCKRSRAVNGATNVVGVMGKSHLRGVAYTLCTDQGALRFKDLVGVQLAVTHKQYNKHTEHVPH